MYVTSRTRRPELWPLLVGIQSWVFKRQVSLGYMAEIRNVKLDWKRWQNIMQLHSTTTWSCNEQ